MSDARLGAAGTATDRIPAVQLNRECFCVTLDQAALNEALRTASGDATFADLLAQRPHLYSHTPVFLPKSDAAAMQAIVAALEAAAGLAGYQAAAMSWAPEIAKRDFGTRGAFMGYDFHLGDDGPKLIEINTNAGGAFFNAFLAGAQIACCAEVERALAREALAAFEPSVVAMFEAEWRTQRPSGQLRTIAIADDEPAQQYLYPEFILAKTLLERHGHDASIVDARELRYENGVLQAAGRGIDMVYNRLVDFALTAPEHAALRTAYLDGAVVLTPNPCNHARHADKRNLALLSDQAALRDWGLAEEQLQVLRGLPHAQRVNGMTSAELWSERKRYFFKPASGHGGKAVYRGDKLTKKAWETVLSGDYIAQEFAPPSERTILLGGERMQRKLDVRLYTYAGEMLLAVARLYQGQTTNFRTPGGGFAPVFFI
jgi:glutathione synthase/RimK-type ligase-like ATP-grasp enzyme